MTSPYDFAVRTFGPQGAPAVLALHGFMGRGDDWEEVASFLGDRYRFLAVDLPGHGATRVAPPEENFRMERVAAGIAELIDERRPCHLIGYSMGGRLALYLAAHHPRRFARVVIESAGPGLPTEEEREKRRRHDASVARRFGEVPYERFLEAWYGDPLFDSIRRDRSRFAQLRARRREGDPAGFAASLRWMGTGSQPSVWDALGAIAAPVLVITGALDRKFRTVARRMCERMTDAVHVEVMDAGHNVHWERPAAFAFLAGTFLDGMTPGEEAEAR